MDPRILHRTLIGALVLGGLFGGVALLQALRAGAPFPDVVQPLLLFTVLGATVGALAGPLVGGALSRLRGGQTRHGNPAVEDGEGESKARPIDRE